MENAPKTIVITHSFLHGFWFIFCIYFLSRSILAYCKKRRKEMFRIVKSFNHLLYAVKENIGKNEPTKRTSLLIIKIYNFYNYFTRKLREFDFSKDSQDLFCLRNIKSAVRDVLHAKIGRCMEPVVIWNI